MDQVKDQENYQDRDQQSQEGKLVPVTESIRYRKRAQSAEAQARELGEQLSSAQERIANLSERLDGLQLEKQLTEKLSQAGTVDTETATLLAKERLGQSDDKNVDACIEQLRKEKSYLFSGQSGSLEAVSRRMSPARRDRSDNSNAIQRAAKRAAQTGDRADLQEYLRLRRSV